MALLEKEKTLYSITKLTDYGKELLLKSNSDFSFDSYVFVDGETNYNLVNKSNIISKGFGKIDVQEEDDYSDVLALPIFDALYKTEDIEKYLIGQYNRH